MMWLSVAIAVAVAIAVVGFVALRARSIERQQREYETADDLRRADDHDANPPFDDTAGWL